MIIKTCSFITRHRKADRIIMNPSTGVPEYAIYLFENYSPSDDPDTKMEELKEMLDQLQQQLNDAAEILKGFDGGEG